MAELKQYWLTKKYAQQIRDLPHPPNQFEWSEVAVDARTLRQLKVENVLVRVERREDTGSIWRVSREAYELAGELLERIERLDCCGSTGVKNRGGDLYCIQCGAPVTRAQAERVLA